MRAERLCFDCAYWKDYIDNPTPGTAIVSGALYVFEPSKKAVDRRCLHTKGITFAIDMCTRDIVYCISPVFKAKVSPAFAHLLSDQYRFISADTYFKIKEYCASDCKSKGCFDRYHCYWYNVEEMERYGAWNKLPKGYVIGGEMCESFINKELMYVDY